MGGVASGRDALELLAAGASAVALGTVLFTDPDAPVRVRRELAALLSAHGFANPEAAVSHAHAERPGLDREARPAPEKRLHFAPNARV
jgi:dihydroorotate dehydrogenase (NAD+) catalytic subunit